MKTEHFAHFDTHAAVKHLHAAGLEDRVAEAIVNSISISRKTDLSNLVSKDDFFEFKEELNERFNGIDKRLDKIEHSIDSLRKDTKTDIEALRKDTKTDIEALRKDVIATIANNKSETIKWVFGLFATQVISVITLLVTILLKSHF